MYRTSSILRDPSGTVADWYLLEQPWLSWLSWKCKADYFERYITTGESGSTYRRFQGLTNNRIIVPGESWQAASCNRASLWKGHKQNDHQLTQFCTKRRRYKSPLQFQPCYPPFKNLHYRSRNSAEAANQTERERERKRERATREFKMSKI